MRLFIIQGTYRDTAVIRRSPNTSSRVIDGLSSHTLKGRAGSRCDFLSVAGSCGPFTLIRGSSGAVEVFADERTKIPRGTSGRGENDADVCERPAGVLRQLTAPS